MIHKLILPLPVLMVIISCAGNKRETTDLVALQLKGDSIVSRTFDTLRNTLSQSIGERGFAGAVDFCNINALPLTNTYATENILIKRISSKLRNPGNAADTMEQRILSTYSQWNRDNQELHSIIEKDKDGNHHFYKPIIIQAMCLNCHGNKDTQILPETWLAIQSRYPSDSAFNYKEGDLRGAWHVKFLAMEK